MEEKTRVIDESELRNQISDLLEIRREIVKKIRKANMDNIEELRRAYDNANYKLEALKNRLNDNWNKAPKTYGINNYNTNKPKMKS